MKTKYNSIKVYIVAGLVALLLIPAFTLAVQTNEISTELNESDSSLVDANYTLTIKGGIGYYTSVFNNGPGPLYLIINYTAVAYGIFRKDCIRNITGFMNLSPLPENMGWGKRIIPIITLHPFAWITVTMWTETVSIERSGLQLFSNFFMFLTGPESVSGP